MGQLISQIRGSSAPNIVERPVETKDVRESYDSGWVVTVYNNEHNTYEEVMNILILATGCDHDEAYLETWEIDHLGCSVVHHGKEDTCRKVAEVIAKIGIRTEVSQE
jgi:hypothetical protein